MLLTLSFSVSVWVWILYFRYQMDCGEYNFFLSPDLMPFLFFFLFFSRSQSLQSDQISAVVLRVWLGRHRPYRVKWVLVFYVVREYFRCNCGFVFKFGLWILGFGGFDCEYFELLYRGFWLPKKVVITFCYSKNIKPPSSLLCFWSCVVAIGYS